MKKALAQLAGSSVLMLRQRLELAALDVEEELLRLGLLFIVSIAGVLLGALACAGVAAAVLMHFWDSARIEAMVAIIGIFAVGSASCAAWVSTMLRTKAGLLHGTLSELDRDEASLGSAA
jgi:uncharacterized membrane protein YqjE